MAARVLGIPDLLHNPPRDRNVPPDVVIRGGFVIPGDCAPIEQASQPQADGQ